MSEVFSHEGEQEALALLEQVKVRFDYYDQGAYDTLLRLRYVLELRQPPPDATGEEVRTTVVAMLNAMLSDLLKTSRDPMGLVDSACDPAAEDRKAQQKEQQP